MKDRQETHASPLTPPDTAAWRIDPTTTRQPRWKRLFFAVAATAAVWSSTLALRAAGLYQDGAGARAMGMGGTGTAVAADPLDALFDNPAALGQIDHLTAQLGVDTGVVLGKFHNRANEDSTMADAGVIPQFAVSVPVGPVHFGLGVNPDIAGRTDWRYIDAPGGADGRTSYGTQTNASQVILLRGALGASWQVHPAFSVGASVGLLYNENILHAPYVFQSQPTLRGAKTLLDLRTDGFGVNAQGGLRWQPIAPLILSVSYTSRARIETYGRATGNADEQFANLGLDASRPHFAYDAEVTNIFPQQVSAGVAWKATVTLTLSAQFDWLDWSDAFEKLPIHLTKGNNPNLNGLLGSSRLDDTVPLRWSDQYVGRVGAEKTFGDHWAVRAGYAYGNNPVPDGTITPLNAAITEHLLTAGVGYRTGRWRIDAAYQWQVPATARVGRSGLASSEYSDSVIEVNVQQFNLTVGYSF